MVERGGLENRCGPLGHRGFESHPLRLKKPDTGLFLCIAMVSRLAQKQAITQHWAFKLNPFTNYTCTFCNITLP